MNKTGETFHWHKCNTRHFNFWGRNFEEKGRQHCTEEGIGNVNWKIILPLVECSKNYGEIHVVSIYMGREKITVHFRCNLSIIFKETCPTVSLACAGQLLKKL